MLATSILNTPPSMRSVGVSFFAVVAIAKPLAASVHMINPRNTSSDNNRAIACYERIGFCEDDVVSFGKRLIEDQ